VVAAAHVVIGIVHVRIAGARSAHAALWSMSMLVAVMRGLILAAITLALPHILSGPLLVLILLILLLCGLIVLRSLRELEWTCGRWCGHCRGRYRDAERCGGNE
jgi:hypothetical protein